MKVFNTGIIVGRFQHIHNGHEKIINIGRSLCETLLIFVGSAGEKTSSRNPYDYEYRKNLIEMIYKEDIKKGNVIIKPLKDLENKDDSQLRLGLNEIYARHHCTFKTPEIADYFKSKSWYSADETLTSEMMNNHMSEYFNEIELKNISFIQAHR